MSVTGYWKWTEDEEHPQRNATLDGVLVAAAVAAFWFDVLLSLPFIRGSENWWLAAVPIPGAIVFGLFLGKPVTRRPVEAAAACIAMAIGAVATTFVVGFATLAGSDASIGVVAALTLGLFSLPLLTITVASAGAWAAVVRFADRSSSDMRSAVRLGCVCIYAIGVALWVMTLAGV
jgi:hypothetical protein